MPQFFRLPIEGNSMDRAGLRDGMRVRVRLTSYARSGQIVVVRELDGAVTVKRLRWRQGCFWLVPESSDPTFQPRRALEGEVVLAVVAPPAPTVAFYRSKLVPPRVVPASALPAPPPKFPRPAVGGPPLPADSIVAASGRRWERRGPTLRPGAPAPPPLPEDVFPYCYGRTIVGRRLRAIAQNPPVALAMVAAYQAWEREWVEHATWV